MGKNPGIPAGSRGRAEGEQVFLACHLPEGGPGSFRTSAHIIWLGWLVPLLGSGPQTHRKTRKKHTHKATSCDLFVLCVCAKLLQSCPSLCDALDWSPQGSSVHGILQVRILEWLPCPSSGDFPHPGIKPVSLMSPALAGSSFTTKFHMESP